MEFEVDTPIDDMSTPANTIHNYIQDMKTMIRERMECNNGSFKEHGDVFDEDDGSHEPSVISFVRVHSTLQDLQDYSPKVPTSVHIVTESLNYGIYVIDDDLNIVQVSAGAVHGELDDLDLDSAHSQYLLVDGSRSMSGNMKLVSEDNLTHSTTYDSDDKPLETSHANEPDFHSAHGDDSISSRHLDGNANINKSQNIQEQSIGSDLTITDYSSKVIRYFPVNLFSQNESLVGDDRVNLGTRSKTGDEQLGTPLVRKAYFVRCTYKSGSILNCSISETKTHVNSDDYTAGPPDDFVVYKYNDTRTV